MRVNGFGAQAKALADLARGESLTQQAEDLELTVAELVQGAGLTALALAGKDLEDLAGHLLAEIDLALQHLVDGLDQLLAALALHNVAARARPQRPLGIHLFVVHGHDQHGDFGIHRAQVFNELDAFAPGHRQVHEHDIRS